MPLPMSRALATRATASLNMVCSCSNINSNNNNNNNNQSIRRNTTCVHVHYDLSNIIGEKSERVGLRGGSVEGSGSLSSSGVLRRILKGVVTSQRRALHALSIQPTNAREMTFDTIGSWNSRLLHDLEKADQSEASSHPTCTSSTIKLSAVGKHSLIGRRPANEDRVIAAEIRPNLLMFGILDGHGGKMAAEYAQDQLPKNLRYYLDKGETNLEKILHMSFVNVNDDIARIFDQGNNDNKVTDGVMSSGTTATVCLISDGVQLTVAHVGDSRATLCRHDASLRLTVDHLPSVTSEVERVISAGGHVTWNSVGRSRVNGRLEMTRSLGDIDLKPFGVIAEPDLRTIELDESSDSCLVLTTDGVHNRLNSSRILQLVRACVDAHEAAEVLTDHALLQGSDDNCTAVVIPLAAWEKYADGVRQIHFSGVRNSAICTYG